MVRDISLLLGVPALLLGAIGYATWPWFPVPYEAASQEEFYRMAAGVWDWESDSSCVANPQAIRFTPDRSTMILTMRRTWTNGAGQESRTAIYDLSNPTLSSVRGAIRGEERLTDAGDPVVWDLVLTSPESFAWHRADWPAGSLTGALRRCPPGTDSLIPPLSPAEQAALGVDQP